MECRRFGPTGLTVSALGLGCFDLAKAGREAWGDGDGRCRERRCGR